MENTVVPSPAHQFCYRHQCVATTEAVAEYLELKPKQYTTTFQSRLGLDPWLQPYTDKTVAKWPNRAPRKWLLLPLPLFRTA